MPIILNVIPDTASVEPSLSIFLIFTGTVVTLFLQVYLVVSLALLSTLIGSVLRFVKSFIAAGSSSSVTVYVPVGTLSKTANPVSSVTAVISTSKPLSDLPLSLNVIPEYAAFSIVAQDASFTYA